MKRLILRTFQSPGDVLMLTAAVRDLHHAFPGQFQTDVRTSAEMLWLNNPFVTPLQESAAGVQTIDMHYPLIHQSNQRPYHFLHGYVQYLEEQLNARIPVRRFGGEVYLTDQEKLRPIFAHSMELPDRFWIVIAGGKYDFTAKWWNPENYQQVVDHFQGRIHFVQCGEQGHWHPPLENVTNLIGQTDLRQFLRLMYHAEGVLCPVTFAMHLAAAVETKPGRPPQRPCVVVAGGREPPHWEAYPGHQFLHTIGTLPCCAEGGCWRSRCQRVRDGDDKDHRHVCELPVQVQPNLFIPRCMDMITPRSVIEHMELYLTGEQHRSSGSKTFIPLVPTKETPAKKIPVLLQFHHGLGDAVQLTMVLQHLRVAHPDWSVDVAALQGKHTAFMDQCNGALILNQARIDPAHYDKAFVLDWHECRSDLATCPSTKAARCLQEVFQITPQADLCRYLIHVRDQAKEKARNYLAEVCGDRPLRDGRFPAVLIHYQGNTSGDRKDLPGELIQECCELILQCGAVPIILDWDRRCPFVDGLRVHNPGADHWLWGATKTGDAETLAALMDQALLVVGVDSGPLHVAGATSTPTLAVWTHHHPVHYFDLADNVLHLVPGNHEELAAGPAARRFFRDNYRSRTYKQLFVDLPAMVQSLLTGEDPDLLANKNYLDKLTATAYGERYYLEHQAAGLDYLNFGEWQQQYGRWFVDSLGLRGKTVLDVGCACGSILRGLGQGGAVVQGVEINEFMVKLGRMKWPDMAKLLHICDAVNLHLFDHGAWDALHSAQVAEHWKPELVPLILRELARITKPGGLFFCCLDTDELFARQGREMEREDPTHVCIRTMSWWHQQLQENGWQVCSQEFDSALRHHPESFLQRYDWDWFIARKAP
jgi:ADP-heptose:LPS heptosyltransferase/SAM-dependent methyltransferase